MEKLFLEYGKLQASVLTWMGNILLEDCLNIQDA